jgi:hypothetical protein
MLISPMALLKSHQRSNSSMQFNEGKWLNHAVAACLAASHLVYEIDSIRLSRELLDTS